ncbi:MAG: TetR/AcrR family transcriptional regulator [Acetatifactor sp.]|nr:TetR/AcrR family transcriptional regulator [Acetatifactor sp.]
MQLRNILTNQKSEFTRRCVGEAVILLLKKNDFNRIKVSDIVKKAGVSRTSFYKYYSSAYSVLTDYLNIIVSEYVSSGEELSGSSYFDYDHIVFSFNFFDRYSDFFLTLSKNNLHSVMLEGVNEFMLKHMNTDHSISVYKLYAYAGALLNSFLKWEEGGKQERVEDIAATLVNIVK